MNTKGLIIGVVAALIIAGAGFAVAGSIGMDGASFAAGAVVAGVLAAVLAALGSAPAAQGEPAAVTAVPSAPGAERSTLFVGNLAFKANRIALQKLFSDYGQVHSARIMLDRATRRPRGYGFVEMDAADAEKAIKALDGAEFFGRPLKVSLAKERMEE